MSEGGGSTGRTLIPGKPNGAPLIDHAVCNSSDIKELISDAGNQCKKLELGIVANG